MSYSERSILRKKWGVARKAGQESGCAAAPCGAEIPLSIPPSPLPAGQNRRALKIFLFNRKRRSFRLNKKRPTGKGV